METTNGNYTINQLASLKSAYEAHVVLMDLLNAGKSEGTFYITTVKTAIEVNDFILREAKTLLHEDSKVFRGYDRQISTFVNAFQR